MIVPSVTECHTLHVQSSVAAAIRKSKRMLLSAFILSPIFHEGIVKWLNYLTTRIIVWFESRGRHDHLGSNLSDDEHCASTNEVFFRETICQTQIQITVERMKDLTSKSC